MGGKPDACSCVPGGIAGLAEALRLPQAGGASLLMLAEGFLGRGRSRRDGLELAIRCVSSPFVSSVILTVFPVDFSAGFLLLFEPSSCSHSSTDLARLSCHETDSTGGQDSKICVFKECQSHSMDCRVHGDLIHSPAPRSRRTFPPLEKWPRKSRLIELCRMYSLFRPPFA